MVQFSVSAVKFCLFCLKLVVYCKNSHLLIRSKNKKRAADTPPATSTPEKRTVPAAELEDNEGMDAKAGNRNDPDYDPEGSFMNYAGEDAEAQQEFISQHNTRYIFIIVSSEKRCITILYYHV